RCEITWAAVCGFMQPRAFRCFLLAVITNHLETLSGTIAPALGRLFSLVPNETLSSRCLCRAQRLTRGKPDCGTPLARPRRACARQFVRRCSTCQIGLRLFASIRFAPCRDTFEQSPALAR